MHDNNSTMDGREELGTVTRSLTLHVSLYITGGSYYCVDHSMKQVCMEEKQVLQKYVTLNCTTSCILCILGFLGDSQ